MGFNTVAFLLNDMMSDIERAPRTLAHALSHPSMHSGDADLVRNTLYNVARANGEHWNHQALTVLPTWHADGFKFFVAGRNTIAELKWLRGGRTKGSTTATVELPSWWPQAMR